MNKLRSEKVIFVAEFTGELFPASPFPFPFPLFCVEVCFVEPLPAVVVWVGESPVAIVDPVIEFETVVDTVSGVVDEVGGTVDEVRGVVDEVEGVVELVGQFCTKGQTPLFTAQAEEKAEFFPEPQVFELLEQE